MAEEEVRGRVMPHSIEAEQSVIGAMLMDADAIEIASEILREDDFYARQYGVLFAAITEMYRKGMAVDPVTLQTRLREKNLPPEVYSSGMIMELIDRVPTSANIKTYAEIVVEKSLLRKMIRANEEIAGSCYEQKDEIEDMLQGEWGLNVGAGSTFTFDDGNLTVESKGQVLEGTYEVNIEDSCIDGFFETNDGQIAKIHLPFKFDQDGNMELTNNANEKMVKN